MDWSDEGIVLSCRALGEANAIVELLTRAHGRHLGLVRGGRSRRVRPLLQPGNVVAVTWRARLSEHLGSFTIELSEARAALILDDERALSAVTSLATLAKLLPERDPHRQLYATALQILRAFDDELLWPALLVHWEMMLLQDLGFGIDLSECAATGTDIDLAFVSPRSGRAVSRVAGEPYVGKLLKLPRFLVDEDAGIDAGDIAAGFALTGHFLTRDVLEPHGLAMPQARERLIGLLARTPRAA
ncbi:MAG: DNA repair protein RecO [Methyloceanibacter sp.]|uniref:DNA repair protein RecO n=1 Tax=Methyloceanibacter sp. TaxID=1965321 RepID=UPI003D9B1235